MRAITTSRRIRLLAIPLVLLVGILLSSGASNDTPQPNANPTAAAPNAGDRSAADRSTADRMSAQSGEGMAEVVRIVDGDTIVVRLGGQEEKVRLIGINTPESVDPRKPVECFGKEAGRHLAELVPEGTAVQLVRDVEERDRYERLLAYIYRASDGLFVNLAQVADGFAEPATYPPNVAHVDEFATAARSARDRNLGLWAACPPS